MLTWLEIDARAIRYNLRQFKKLAGRNVLLMPVIKANAYGHGFLNVAKICEQSPDADRICVVNLQEALTMIKNKITKKPIIILSFFDHNEKELAVAAKNNVIFPLYNLADAKILNKAGDKAKKTVKVHLKVDTGASRLGILPNEALTFVKQIKKFPRLEVEGLWSHFASSEDNFSYTKTQHETLKLVDANLKKYGFVIPLKHIACSAAITAYKFTHEDALRLGLSLYGLYPNKNRGITKLKPALSWYTTVIQVKTVPAGVKIGYGGTYATNRPTKIAVLPIGYFDGYDRRLSNRGSVLIKGERCPILGRICMNICMVDVTNLPVKAGDKATVVGREKNNCVSLDDLAEWCGTINYEISSRINPLLPRIEK